ncbi:MAG TPA: DUF3793 family protein [Firmicutes bacterium]|nr:DUF3793 family protein [Bacillota bacterium]
MNPTFEELLAFHCAPALAGIKAANLVSCPRQLVEDPEELVAQYGRTLGSRGIHLRILCRCPKGTLILVYREDRLARCLARPAAVRLLVQAGYPVGTVEELLDHLSRRMARRQGTFPHEIGLFLDYPPVDVIGFLRHGGKGCKLCGHWKVYGDAESARRQFQRYDRCRAALTQRVRQGYSLAQLFCAA